MHPQITFNAERHEYSVDNMIIPSVNAILDATFGSIRNRVPAHILNAAAAKGTVVHDEIHEYETNGTRGFTEELQAWIDWCKEEMAIMIASEKIVHCYSPAGEYAGTLDGIIAIGEPNNSTLIDFKTSAKVDKARTSAQLSLYRYALPDNEKPNGIAAVHLRGWKLDMIPLDILSDRECENLINAYYKTKG